jgi:hypothetical protein
MNQMVTLAIFQNESGLCFGLALDAALGILVVM